MHDQLHYIKNLIFKYKYNFYKNTNIIELKGMPTHIKESYLYI